MATHTFELWGPDDDIASGEAGALTHTAPYGRSFTLVTYSGDLGDVTTAYKMRGWKSVGTGDQRPTRPTITQTYSTTATTFPAYTPDVESGAYSGINGALGNNCMSVTNGNELRVAVENLREHCEAIGKLMNTLINIHKAHGEAL